MNNHQGTRQAAPVQAPDETRYAYESRCVFCGGLSYSFWDGWRLIDRPAEYMEDDTVAVCGSCEPAHIRTEQ